MGDIWETLFGGFFSLFGSRLKVHPQEQVLEARFVAEGVDSISGGAQVNIPLPSRLHNDRFTD